MPAAAELVAHGRTEEQIREFIGADWLVYQDLSDLVAACQHDNAKISEFDTSCFSGEYVTGDVTPEYLARLERIRSDAERTRRRGDAPGSLRAVSGV
jgi:amidophosphoribosyltransferase